MSLLMTDLKCDSGYEIRFYARDEKECRMLSEVYLRHRFGWNLVVEWEPIDDNGALFFYLSRENNPRIFDAGHAF